MSKYERPELPYKGKKLPNNNRIDILTKAKKPMTADLLDGEFNYVIDSLNQTEEDIKKAVTGKLVDSDKLENANKVIITDGKKDPTLSWVAVDSNLIANNAIEGKHIENSAVTTDKINNGQVTNAKIKEKTIQADRIKSEYNTLKEKEKHYADWAKKLGKVGSIVKGEDNGKNAIVVRDKNGAVNATTVNAEAISSPTITALETKINNMITKSLQQAIDDAWEKEHPIGTLAFYPHRRGNIINGKKVSWHLMDIGRVLVTGQTINQDKGTNSVIDGSTDGHQLTIEEMPSHNHGLVTYPAFIPGKKSNYVEKGAGGKSGSPTIFTNTESTGRDQPHSHKLDLKRLELLIYRRVS